MRSFTNVRLRAIEPEDLEIIYSIENDSSFWQYGIATVPYSRYALRQYISTAQNDLFKDEQVRLVIEVKDAGGQWSAAGLADLFNFSPMHLRAEVGIVILPAFQQQGVGTQALKALEDYASRLFLHQLYAIVSTNNTPATRLFGQLGYQSSACLQDWLRKDDGFEDALLFQKKLTDHRGNCDHYDSEDCRLPGHHR